MTISAEGAQPLSDPPTVGRWSRLTSSTSLASCHRCLWHLNL